MPIENLTTSSIPPIDCPGTPDEVVARLDAAARRGKLPGFAAGQAGDGTLFSITDFGAPFESRLFVIGKPLSGGTRLEFLPTRLKPLFPLVFALLLVATVWPGSWLTDSMLRSYSDWYSGQAWWITYAWYLPLTIPFCPPALHSALRKSRVSASAEIPDLVAKIVAASGGHAASGKA